ncbi:10829_t:CDS:2, partial [Funneliformis caledonium]
NAVNIPALFIAWLRETYRAVKLGSAQASMKALMSDKFLSIDTPETYEKWIRLRVDALLFADALPILYSHLPKNLELRIKIRNPLEAGRRVSISFFSEETLSHSSIQKESQAEHEFI